MSGRGLDVKKRPCLFITLVNKEFHLILSLIPSLFQSVCFFPCFCLSVSLRLCLSLYLCLSLSLFLSLSVCLTVSVCLTLRLCLSVSLRLCLTVSPPTASSPPPPTLPVISRAEVEKDRDSVLRRNPMNCGRCSNRRPPFHAVICRGTGPNSIPLRSSSFEACQGPSCVVSSLPAVL